MVLRAEDHQSSPLHRLLASSRWLLAGERDSRPSQSSGMALLLEGLPCGVPIVEGGACDAFGPLPAENREAGNPVAGSLALCLSGRRQVQVRAHPSFKVANRVRHFSRAHRSANVGGWVTVVRNLLEGRGRRNLLGRQHSAPGHELVGTWSRGISTCRPGFVDFSGHQSPFATNSNVF